MREDLVVVTVEYRLGLLGFLSDETKQLPGNFGLADVRLALGKQDEYFSSNGRCFIPANAVSNLFRLGAASGC